MQKLLLILLLCTSQAIFAQRGYLLVKKQGIKKVKSFAEGDSIHFKTKAGYVAKGPIALVKGDSVMINFNWYKTGDIDRIILREKKKGQNFGAMLMWTTAGVALSTAGMTLAKWAPFKRSLMYSSIIGYGNLLIRYVPKLKRRYYNIGRKFRVQSLDLHI